MMRKDTAACISPLRQQMIDVMRIAGHAEGTQQAYLREVSRLSQHYRRSPDRLSAEEIKAYVAQRIAAGLKPRTTNVTVAAFKVFYRDALAEPERVQGLRARRKKELLPRPIAAEDVERLIHATFDLRCRTALVTGYGAGLRISEVVALQVEDVCAKQGPVADPRGQGRPRADGPLPAGSAQAVAALLALHPPRTRQRGCSTAPRPRSR